MNYRPEVNPGTPAYQFTAIAGNSIDNDICGASRIPDGSTSVFTHGINSYEANDPLNPPVPPDNDNTQYPQGADRSVSKVLPDGKHYTLEVAFPWTALE